MREIIIAVLLAAACAGSAFAQEVKYIDAPKFAGEIYLYGQPSKEDIDFEQWYEIQGPDTTLLGAEATRLRSGSGLKGSQRLS